MICTNCKADKPEEEFLREKRNVIRLRKSWCKTCTYATTKKWKSGKDIHLRLKDYQLRYDLMRNYGITLEEYKELLSTQDGLCAICRKPEDAKRFGRLSVDHSHKTDKNRGLLCVRCNRAIGFFQEDIELMERAIAYLKVWTDGSG